MLRVRIARDRLAWRLRQRLAVGLRDVEHGNGAKQGERFARLLAARVALLHDHRREDPYRLLALADLAADRLPRLEPCDSRRVRALHRDQHAVPERVAMERGARLRPLPPPVA